MARFFNLVYMFDVFFCIGESIQILENMLFLDVCNCYKKGENTKAEKGKHFSN